MTLVTDTAAIRHVQLWRMPGLRELKKVRTRDEIRRAATELFLERGFDEVTVDDVAAVAGVSARTLFRYFPTKEDLVLDGIREQVGSLLRGMDERDWSSDPLGTLFDAIIAVATDESYGLSADSPAAIIATSDSLVTAALGIQHELRDLLIERLARHTGRSETDVDLRLTVYAAIGAMSTAIDTWPTSDAAGFDEHVRRVLDRLRTGLTL